MKGLDLNTFKTRERPKNKHVSPSPNEQEQTLNNHTWKLSIFTTQQAH